MSESSCRTMRIYRCEDDISNLNGYMPTNSGIDICIVTHKNIPENQRMYQKNVPFERKDYYIYINDAWELHDEIAVMFSDSINHKYFMNQAIDRAKVSIDNDLGGPFGAIIVKDNSIVSFGNNQVLKMNDPTAHGEIVAIREACRVLNTHDLSGCTLYTTGYPCPMCLGAILWANIDKVYYGCSLYDAERIGFNDIRYYELMSMKESLRTDDDKSLYLEQIGREECFELYRKYNMEDHERY